MHAPGVDLSKLPPELVVPPGPTDIKTGTNRDGATELFYTLPDAPFPALGTTSLVRSHLKNLGWSELTHDWLNPDLVNDWQFGTFIDGTKTPNRRVHQWFGEWTNGQGAVVLYIFRYESAMSDELLHRRTTRACERLPHTFRRQRCEPCGMDLRPRSADIRVTPSDSPVAGLQPANGLVTRAEK